MQIDRSNFKNEEKKLKRKYKEAQGLEIVLKLLKTSINFKELENNPLSRIYGFEPLKYQLSGHYSFNLIKHGGTVRLICSFDKENNIVYLEKITTKHYADIKEKLGV